MFDIESSAENIALFPVEFSSPARATIRAGSFTIAPGQSSLTLEAAGTLVVSVQTGSLLLTADRPIEGTEIFGDGTADRLLPETSSRALGDGTGGVFPVTAGFPVSSRPRYFEIDAGNGAVIEEGTIIRFTSVGAEPVQVLFITVTSQPADESSGRQSTGSVAFN